MALLAGVLVAVFAAVTALVLVGDVTAWFDRPVHEWVLGLRGEPFTSIATVITHAGGSVVMWVLGLTACGLLLRRGERADAAFVAAVGVSSAVSIPVLKHLFGRPRPPVGDQLVAVVDPAFPSGHSAGAAAMIGVLAVLLYVRARRRIVALLCVWFAAVFVILVGLSRIYLGVHWPTDVLAGWVLGTALVAFGVLVRRRVGPPWFRDFPQPLPEDADRVGAGPTGKGTPG